MGTPRFSVCHRPFFFCTRKNDGFITRAPAGGAGYEERISSSYRTTNCREGTTREVVMETVATALLAAYRKSFGGGENVRIEVDKNGEVHVWASKRVVAQVKDPNEEISLAEAQRLMPHAALGQSMDVDSSFIFTRIPAQTAKQVILQRIREAEHEHLYDQIKNWVGKFAWELSRVRTPLAVG